jgi:hypothetical protein
MNIEVSPVRRVLFLIALLALILGGPVSGAGSTAPAMARECLVQCGAMDGEQAALPPCCAVAENCRAKPTEPGPYLGTSRPLPATSKSPLPVKEPNPVPPRLTGLVHNPLPLLAKRPAWPMPAGAPAASPSPLSRTCVLRI